MKQLVKHNLLFLLVAALSVVTITTSVNADTIFSNLGPGGTFDNHTAYRLNDNIVLAFAFTPAGSYVLTHIDVALAWISGTNSVSVAIVADSNGVPSRFLDCASTPACLESWTFTNVAQFGSNPLLSANSVLNPVLTQGKQYWMVAYTTNQDSVAGWDLNSTGQKGLLAFAFNRISTWTAFQNTNPNGAFDVIGTPTFSSFSAKMDVTIGPPSDFQINGVFALAAGATALDPTTQPVTLSLGSFSTTVPAHSFIKNPKGAFVFQGTINGVNLSFNIASAGGNKYTFKAEGTGANLAGTVNPIDLHLAIGSNGGSTTVDAQIN